MIKFTRIWVYYGFALGSFPRSWSSQHINYGRFVRCNWTLGIVVTTWYLLIWLIISIILIILAILIVPSILIVPTILIIPSILIVSSILIVWSILVILSILVEAGSVGWIDRTTRSIWIWLVICGCVCLALLILVSCLICGGVYWLRTIMSLIISGNTLLITTTVSHNYLNTKI